MKKPNWLIKVGAKMAEKKPDILVGTGIMLMAGAAILGCVQTAKHMNDVLDDHNAEIEDIKKTIKDVGLEGVENINYLQAIKRVIGMSDKPLANE